MKYLKYFLAILIVFLAPNVFALEVDVTTSITSPNANGRKGTYLGTEIYNTGQQGNYNVNTRYNGKLSRIIYNLPLPTEFGQCFTTNASYTITMYMATNDWNNAFGSVKVRPYSSSSTNWSNGNVTFSSYKKISFKFTIPSSDTTCYDFVWIDLPSTSISNTSITQISNWNLSKITINDPTITSGGSGGSGGTSPTPTPDSSQNIINNQNENTQQVIDNQNENTQQIIDNQNKNTESTNELLGTCHKNLFNVNAYNGNNNQLVLRSDINGFELPAMLYSVESHITLKEFCPECQVGKTYYLKGTTSSTNANYIYVGEVWNYNSSKVLTQAMLNYNVLFYGIYPSGSGTGSVTISDIAIYEGTNNYTYSPYNEQVCTSKLDDTTNAINQQNEYLMDNSDPNISDNEFLNTFNSMGVSDPLSYLLTLPTQLINKIVSLSDTCTAINLGTLYGTMLTLPCINIENIVGTSVWNIIDVIFSVSLLVVIFKNLYDTFSNLITMGAQKEAKEKFSMPTPMDFLSMILGGDR